MTGHSPARSSGLAEAIFRTLKCLAAGRRYTASMRAGRTKTTSFSLDAATLSNLRALASCRHKGNVSALLAEIASREAKFAAAEAYLQKYGVPPLDDEAVERIETEWRGGEPPKRSRRRAA